MIACNENIFTICFLSLFGRAIEIYMQQREFCGIFRVMSMFFSSVVVIVVHEARKRFVGSLKNLVICQFERWHNTKSQFRRAFHLDRSHALSLRHSLNPFQRVQYIISRNDHTCIDFYFYLKWKHFDMEINCVKSNCNALNLLMVIISKTFCFIYESDATTRTYITQPRTEFINQNAINNRIQCWGISMKTHIIPSNAMKSTNNRLYVYFLI